MCSKVLNGHIILTDTSITTILAPEMTYTPILSDTENMGRSDVAEAMVTLRWLHEAIETMTNGDDRAIKIVPYHIPVVKWCD